MCLETCPCWFIRDAAPSGRHGYSLTAFRTEGPVEASVLHKGSLSPSLIPATALTCSVVGKRRTAAASPGNPALGELTVWQDYLE